jgi:hypothetical protein
VISDTEWDAIGTNICLSGGAKGADLQFGMCAGWAGHSVFHFIFDGHKSKAPESEKVILNPSQLLEADPFLIRSNETLRRKWPVSNPFVASLLRRNYYQVNAAEAVYAIANIDDDGMVSGGTSWAVQMFLDRFTEDKRAAFVFDQNSEGWFTWDAGWVGIDNPPAPGGVYAGIGSRELTQNGKDAIRNLYGYPSSS